MAARYAFRRMSTQVMRQVTAEGGPLAGNRRLPSLPRGQPGTSQARNFGGTASESVTQQPGGRLKEAAQDVNLTKARPDDATTTLPGGIKLNFHFQSPAQRPWLYIAAAGTAMGAAGAYVGYKAGRAAAIVWAPVEAVGEKYARAKETWKLKTDGWKNKMKTAEAKEVVEQSDTSSSMHEKSVHPKIGTGNGMIEITVDGVKHIHPTKSVNGEEKGGWKGTVKGAISEKKQCFEKFAKSADYLFANIN